jgi:hypothetical protein
MANVKKVDVEGEMPFSILDPLDFDSDPRPTDLANLKSFFAFLSTPTSGFRIVYPGDQRMVPNKWGGQTAYYRFSLLGSEAVTWDYLTGVLREMALRGTTITKANVRDEGDDFRHVHNLLRGSMRITE